MISRPARRRRICKSEVRKIKAFDEGIDNATRIVVLDPVLKMLWEQHRPRSIYAFHETLHPMPPVSRQKISNQRASTQPRAKQDIGRGLTQHQTKCLGRAFISQDFPFEFASLSLRPIGAKIKLGFAHTAFRNVLVVGERYAGCPPN